LYLTEPAEFNYNSLNKVNKAFVPFLKKHQASGIRFMYDCIIENVSRFNNAEVEKQEIANGGSFGGILAHCMGLGKTFQVIVFVHTLLTNQHLKHKIKRVLIVVPLNVIKNWEFEFDKWFEQCDLHRQFHLFELYSTKGAQSRADLLFKWYKKGGVMLVTSGLFVELFYGDKPCQNIFESCLLNPGKFCHFYLVLNFDNYFLIINFRSRRSNC